MQRQYRRVSFALLRLITGHNDGDGLESTNEDGAWCWRDGCHGILISTWFLLCFLFNSIILMLNFLFS